MDNKIVLGEYLKKDSSVYKVVSTQNNLKRNYLPEKNRFNTNNFHILRFSKENIGIEVLSSKTLGFLKLKRNSYQGGLLLALLSSGGLMGVMASSLFYDNPLAVYSKSLVAATFLMGGAIFSEKLSEKTDRKISEEYLNIENFLSKTNVNILKDAKDYVLESKKEKFSENKINNGLNKIYLENLL